MISTSGARDGSPGRTDTRIVYCRCAQADTLPPAARQELGEALGDSGLRYDAVADLCELAARKSPLLPELAAERRLVIAACHPRAVKWLFAAGNAPLREEGVLFLDMREASAGELRRSILEMAPAGGAAASPVHRVKPQSAPPAVDHSAGPAASAWQPWFPVIDYSRCDNCQQCLGFCLFGVYGVGAEGRVRVTNPISCKTGCPACARICPSEAVIFPKYPGAPINGGDRKPGDPAEPVRVDKAALLEGDILNALQQRGKDGARFAPAPGQGKAFQERLVHLTTSLRPPETPPRALPAKQLTGKEQP